MTEPDDRDEPDTTSLPPVPDPALLEELSQAFDPTAENVRDRPETTGDDAPDPAGSGHDPGPAPRPPAERTPADDDDVPDDAIEDIEDDDAPEDIEDDGADQPNGDGDGDPTVEDEHGTADEGDGGQAAVEDEHGTADEGDGGEATVDDECGNEDDGDEEATVEDAASGPDDDGSAASEAPLATVLPIGEPRLAGRIDEQVGDGEGADGAGGEEPSRTIRIGGDDELPDAVYLDDELEREPSDEGTVFIDDDDTGDALATQEATGHGIEPRIRQRRIGVRRAAGLRRLRWVILAVAVVVVVIGVLAFLASPVFDIDEVNVTGDQYTDPDELQAVVDDLLGTPVLLADTSAAEERLEAIPWVESARVNTDFPDRVDIEIRERRPVAAMPGADGKTRVLDREGRILDVIDGQPIALVWIAGPITLDQPAGEFAPVGPSSGAALVTKLTPTVRRRLDSMLVTPDGSDLQLMLRPLTEVDADGDGVPDDEAADEPGAEDLVDTSTTLPPVAPGSGGPLIEVRFGSAIGDSQQIEKLVRLERVLDDIGTDPVTVIDVSTAEVTIL